MAEVIVRRPGAAKNDPFTICIVANPAMETPWNSGMFQADPIMAAKASFDTEAQYIENCLFGVLSGMKERVLADPSIAPNVRLISIWDPATQVSNATALVGLDGVSNILVARRNQMKAFVNNYSIENIPIQADIIFAVSASPTHTRASAWFTSDDTSRSGVPFSLDGRSLVHSFYCDIPGTIALHISSQDITPLHEFHHAISSYTNGSIVDLYVDSSPGLNCKSGRPIPSDFADYEGVTYSSDSTRDGLGYPAGWSSYHCALIDAAFPAVMDNYYQASTRNPLDCQDDQITRQFVLDRVKAKLSR
ncbi:MAG TPA: hypothetical protein VLK33_13350 [Terriglobales bacterium]|nr:hypothetical protein [Terriglobales bacterium]